MKPKTINGYGALRSVLETARQESGCGLGELTVLSAQVDPYRLDTPQVTAMASGSPITSTGSSARNESTGGASITP